ncbi:hypothetical protein [Pelosinus propionicus]|uniref:ABC-2 family transporter protein n=1 Tax=Pelosinus propionicus DSM 13327 TaxID=1123291 RepID=A0A1I4IK07_9FIRM|nr:hypothetical protein [Pelosinus propionicus]SFL54739.1 hypothetical protein SAMN04490355_1008117 [Pelosinus propionicus DSM 13327]
MDKYQEILSEIDKDGNDEEMVAVLNKLSKYNVPKPTAVMTSSLLHNLKAVLQENDSHDDVPILKSVNRVAIERSANDGSLLSVLRLVKPQLAILSWRFMAMTSLIIFAGIFLTNGDRDSLIFLTNGAPILGLLTLFYEHRAELYGTNELEASCPYTPAQLAGARIIVTLGYTIIVCLTATGMIALSFSDMLTNEKVLLWKTILAWLAPMVFFLGVALAVSLRLGAMYGCGTAFIMWVAKVIFEQSDIGKSLIQISLVGNGLIQRMPMILLVIGLILIAIYLRCLRVENMDYSQEG